MGTFWKTLKRSSISAYDYLGLVIIMSSLFVGLGLVFFLLMKYLIPISMYLPWVFITAALIYIFILSPIVAGAYSTTKMIAARNMPIAKDFFIEISRWFLPAWKLSTLQSLLTIIIIVNILFYLSNEAIILKILAVLFIYFLIFWWASCLYHFPIMIEQKTGPFLTAKRGFLLVLDNPGFTAMLFFVIILIACICIATFAGLVFVYLGYTSILITYMTRVLFTKYNIVSRDEIEEPEIIDDGFPSIDE